MVSEGAAALIHVLEDYVPTTEEVPFVPRFLELIQKHTNCFYRDLKHAHITGSAWVINETREYALMTHHAKLDRWLQMGGHADGDSDIGAVALREATEESGLKSIKPLLSTIFDLDIHTIPERKDEPEHEHFDIRYCFVADMTEVINRNHESKEMAWIRMNELKELTGNNRSINRMVEKTFSLEGKVSANSN